MYNETSNAQANPYILTHKTRTHVCWWWSGLSVHILVSYVPYEIHNVITFRALKIAAKPWLERLATDDLEARFYEFWPKTGNFG